MLNQITRSKPVALTIATLLTLVVAVLDYVAGPEMILAAYYTFPILLAAWTCGFRWGVAFSLVAYLIIIATAANVGHPFSQPSYFWFDTTNILLVFLVVAFLAARLRQSWDALDALARTDPLTGILNRKAFQDAVEAEINRQARSHLPFTLFHIDCDNFKEVNDTRGHKEGDKVLIAVAQTLAASLRKSDIVARLGGDEFGVMLTAANAPESLVVARGLLEKVRVAMAAGGWPVSVSIGVAVYTKPPASALAAIDEADRIMYQVKQAGKNDLMQRVIA
jgi:diguanylate cyclase (GGDEF)-like protein